ncbi:MAG: four helix bundle protein [Bacteroidetes bacterium]|nr:four helix bundle protein [Bacteroidota bacterium]
MEIFRLTRKFPKEEIYSLTSQVIRSSRSISSNIVEGWAKRFYENKFKVHLIDSLGSTAETSNWILFARDCSYITQEEFYSLNEKLESIGKMLTKLHQKWNSTQKTSNAHPPVSNL